MPDAIITSTASTFGTITGTFAADQSTITGTITGIVAGTLTGSVGVPGPQGPAGPGSTWGGIAGTLSAQSDLWSELGTKYLATNPAGYQTAAQVSTALSPYITSASASASFYPLSGNPSAFLQAAALTPYLLSSTAASTYQTLAGMSSYLTTSAAAAGYYPLSGNPSGFLTAASLSGYATESFVTSQGYITSSALTPYLLKAGGTITGNIISNTNSTFSSYDGTYKTVSFNGTNLQLNNAGPGGSALTVEWDGITFASGKQTLPYPGAATLFSSPVLTGDPTAPTPATSDNDTSIATTAFVKAQGYLTSAPVTSVAGRTGAITLSNTDISGLGTLAVVNDAPSNGSQYARKNGAWDVVVPGDRYLTTSTTSNTINNGNKTFTIGTGLSYTPTQNITISYDASHHMHGEVLTYNSGTGVLTVDINYHTGSGTYAAWVVNVGGVTPQTSVAWGDVTGVLSAQTDLQSALDLKLDATTAASTYYLQTNPDGFMTVAVGDSYYYPLTNPSGFITAYNADLSYLKQSYNLSDLTDLTAARTNLGLGTMAVETASNYLTTSAASSTYLTQSNASSTYQTISGMSSYLTTATAASTYQTQAGMSSYLTTAAAAAGYYPLTGNPSGFLTSAPVTSVAGRTGAITLANTDISGLGTMSTATAADYSTTSVANGLYYPLSSNPASYLVAADIAGKAPLASPALTGNVTITSNSANPALVITQDGAGDIVQFKDVTSDTTYSFINASGKVTTIPAVTASAGFNIPHGTAPTTFVDGDIWTTTSGLFARINGSSNQIMDLTTAQTVGGNKTFTSASLTLGNSTAAGTIAIGNGSTVSGSTRTIAIGTASAAGSTNTINIGGGSGTSTTTLNGTTNFTGPITGAINNITLGNGTAVSTYNLFTGATISGSTKTVNIGTSGAAGSTTTITIGNTTGSTTTLQGTTNGVTAAADTNSTALATTAFVVGQAGSATPIVNGTAAVGTSLRYARQDHVHPTDTSRAPLASPTFTGTVTIPAGASISGFAPLASPSLTGTPLSTTAAADTNTTQIATTAFVIGQASSTTPANNGTAAVGTSAKYARADHVHATDTTRAPLASPTFTGTVTIPAGASISGFAPLASPSFTGTPSLPTGTTAVTQTAGNNTTAVATTAFVTTATSGLTNNVKAWVNFNGTGTPAIRASLNVSSITDNGTGDYTVNFTTAMTDANYAMSCFAGDTAFSVGVTLSSWGTYTQTTSAFRLKVYYSLNTVVDATNILATFIR